MESKAVLAVDNSIDLLNLALSAKGVLLEERRIKATLPPSQVLPGHVEQMLSGHGLTVRDLSSVAVTLGPGSFTGMRVALAFAKGLTAGLSIPIIGVPTLDVLASPFDFLEDVHVLPLIDAKKGEVFTALYRASGGMLERLTGIQAIKPPATVSLIRTPCVAFGTGVELCEPFFPQESGIKVIRDSFFSVSAACLLKEALRLPESGQVRDPALIYGRRSEAEIRFNVTVT